jgi:hypothetical protein
MDPGSYEGPFFTDRTGDLGEEGSTW